MMRRIISMCVLLGLTMAAPAFSQNQPPAVATPTPAAQPTVRLQIVLVRYADTKRVASEPYELLLVPNGENKVLRTGAEVPVALGAAGSKENSNGYKSIGTQLVCSVRLDQDGRFRTSVSVTSSSVYPSGQKQPDRSSFRTFTLNGEAFLKAGERVEIASATDSLSGEVIKAEVTVNPVK